MQICHFYTTGLSINSYMVIDESSGKAAVIDPTCETMRYVQKALEHRVSITDILETHVHADFASGSLRLKEALKGRALIHASHMGGEEWTPRYADHKVKDGDKISLGKVVLQALHTPGHTPEHLCWTLYDEMRSPAAPFALFSGDLLLAGSVGRPDLLGDKVEHQLAEKLYTSLFSVLSALPDHVQVYPGHGADSLCGKEIANTLPSSLGYEKTCNRWLLPTSFPKWHQELLEGMPKAPAYFKRMKQLNVEGFSSKLDVPTFGKLLQYEEGQLLIDIRSVDKFAGGHIPGSVNMPLLPHFPLWAASLISGKQKIVLVTDDVTTANLAKELLALVGLAGVCGYLLIGDAAAKETLRTLDTITAQEFKKDISRFFVIDVRKKGEWDAGHIQSACHIDLDDLESALDKIPQKTPLAILCRTGTRASIAASLLLRANKSFLPVNVSGGMLAYNKS